MTVGRLLAMLIIAGLTLYAETPGTISDLDTKILVRAAFRTEIHAPAEEVDPMTTACGPDFVEFASFSFSIGYSWRTGLGAATAVFFVIQRRTGEVWDAVSGHVLTGKKLERVQRMLRKRLGVSADEVGRVRAMTPACLAGLQVTGSTCESNH